MVGFSKKLAVNPKGTVAEGKDVEDEGRHRWVCLSGWMEGACDTNPGRGHAYPTLVEIYRKKLSPFPGMLLILSIYFLPCLHFHTNQQHQKSEVTVKLQWVMKSPFLHKSDFEKHQPFYVLCFLWWESYRPKSVVANDRGTMQAEDRMDRLLPPSLSLSLSLSQPVVLQVEVVTEKRRKFQNRLRRIYYIALPFQNACVNEGRFSHLPNFL